MESETAPPLAASVEEMFADIAAEIAAGASFDPSSEKRKRGRPPLGLLDRTRAACWAWGVQERAGISFAQLEREMSPGAARKRAAGGYEQSCAWYKYAKGLRAPLPPEHGSRSPVVLANRRYPGTANTYHSITWDLLYSQEKPLSKPLRLTHRISTYVVEKLKPSDIECQNSQRILLTNDGIQKAVLIKHFDALGLLLMQWRNGTPDRLSTLLVLGVRNWLLHACELNDPYPKFKKLMLSLFEERVPELGVLSGPGGLDLRKDIHTRLNDAWLAAHFFGGVPPDK